MKGLTLKQAYESGKPFKHSSMDFWVRHQKGNFEVRTDMALSTEWETWDGEIKNSFTAEDMKRVINAGWKYDMRNANFADYQDFILSVAGAR